MDLNPIQWFKQRQAQAEMARRAERQAFLDALKAVVDISVSASQANERTSEALLAWLQLFQAQGKPTTWAHNDLTETVAEAQHLQRLRDSGFPVDAPAVDQGLWVSEQSDFLLGR